jgi:copper(I)-binding protein
MLIDLRRALAVGDSVRLRLQFSDRTSVAVTVPVKTP